MAAALMGLSTNCHIPMIHETTIPCSDCGTGLVERTVHVRELSVPTDWNCEVSIAECPSCDAQYYPEEALSRLFSISNNTRSRRKS